MPMQADARSPIYLQPGQALRLYVEAETSLIATRGRVSISEAPLWLCDQFLEQKAVLYDGEWHVVQHAGWITMQGRGFAEIRCLPSSPQATPGRGLRSFMRSLLRRVFLRI